MKRALVAGFVVGLLSAWVGCGGDDASSTNGAGASGAAGPGSTGTGGSGAGTGTGGNGTGGDGTGGTPGGAGASCAKEPPPGSELAADPPAYSGGTCPALMDGFNTITSSGNERTFRLVLPANLDPAERVPVMFLWHWLNASADSFYQQGEVQAAADQQRFIAVIPEAKGDLQFTWPYDAILVSDARVDEEFVFFDDMLACVSEQYAVNKECVSSAGVSAGALFTDQLAGGRGQYLASILSLSGGVGGQLIRPWTAPNHKMPALVLWGGPDDICGFGPVGLNFEEISHNLEQELTAGGHFFLECIHNCGHAAPPLDVPPGTSAFAPLWQFVMDHPYWLKAGESPYWSGGVPPELPTWCAIGAGSATPRTDPECPDPGC